jgi:hypothetical protein
MPFCYDDTLLLQGLMQQGRTGSRIKEAMFLLSAFSQYGQTDPIGPELYPIVGESGFLMVKKGAWLSGSGWLTVRARTHIVLRTRSKTCANFILSRHCVAMGFGRSYANCSTDWQSILIPNCS